MRKRSAREATAAVGLEGLGLVEFTALLPICSCVFVCIHSCMRAEEWRRRRRRTEVRQEDRHPSCLQLVIINKNNIKLNVSKIFNALKSFSREELLTRQRFIFFLP
jgi:hypothetical protein